MEKKKQRTLGDAIVDYTSDYDPTIGLMDTDVKINDAHICVIEGAKIDEFQEKLEEIINTYRI